NMTGTIRTVIALIINWPTVATIVLRNRYTVRSMTRYNPRIRSDARQLLMRRRAAAPTDAITFFIIFGFPGGRQSTLRPPALIASPPKAVIPNTQRPAKAGTPNLNSFLVQDAHFCRPGIGLHRRSVHQRCSRRARPEVTRLLDSQGVLECV